jgi:hypothetical protein
MGCPFLADNDAVGAGIGLPSRKKPKVEAWVLPFAGCAADACHAKILPSCTIGLRRKGGPKGRHEDRKIAARNRHKLDLQHVV